MTCSHVRSRFPLLLGLVSLVILASHPASADTTTGLFGPLSVVSAGPVLTAVACTGGVPGILTVTGDKFTAGGEVAIVLYEHDSAKPDGIRSARASENRYGPNGSADPARGFIRGGALSATLEHRCDATAMVRAYDWQTDLWSNWLNVAKEMKSTTTSSAKT